MNTVSISKLKKSYGEKIVADGFSIELPIDGVTVLTGESGCGKTTLLRLIAGLEKPDCGEITGVPEKISFMFQEDRLLEWYSAYENIKYVSDKETAEKYLEKVFLTDDRDTPASSLSGGMKRRVALARTLAYESGLVILDEPFKGMDYELKIKMIELVLNESKNRPFIVVVHESEEAKLLGGIHIHLGGIPIYAEK